MNYSRPNSQAGSIRSQGSSNGSRRPAKTKIHLQYACYICGNLSENPGQILGHIEEIHGHHIPPRDLYARRPLEREYKYVPLTNNRTDIIDHCACPSCWFHCPQDDLESLNMHTLDVHNPERLSDEDENEEENEEEEEEENEEEDMEEIEKEESTDTNKKNSKRPRNSSSNRLTNRPNKRLDISDRGQNLVPTTSSNSTSTSEISVKLEELADLVKTLFTTKK